MWPFLIGWSKVALCVLYKAKASFFWPPLALWKVLSKGECRAQVDFSGGLCGRQWRSATYKQWTRPNISTISMCSKTGLSHMFLSICWFPQFSSETSSWPWSIGHCGEGGRMGLWRVRSALLIQDRLTVFGIIALLSFLFDQETVEWRKWKPQILPL